MGDVTLTWMRVWNTKKKNRNQVLKKVTKSKYIYHTEVEYEMKWEVNNNSLKYSYSRNVKSLKRSADISSTNMVVHTDMTIFAYKSHRIYGNTKYFQFETKSKTERLSILQTSKHVFGII
jgi:hypothetical protein